MNPRAIQKKLDGFDVRNVAHMDALMDVFDASVQEFFGVVITEVQKPIAREIIYRVLLQKRHTIDISACRQIGKTEIVCYALWFLTYWFNVLIGDPFRAIITAPEKTTGSEVFDRTKKLYDKCESERPDEFLFKQKNLDVIVLVNDSRIDTFGLFKGFTRREEKKTTKEGRACNVLVRDEKHLGDDDIFKDELEPALATTGGVDIWVGNGGFRQCRAKELAEVRSRDDVTIFKFDFDYMKAAMVKENERTGNEMFLRWIDSQQKYIDDYGWDSDEVRKNLRLHWIVEVGNFISWENLIGHRRENNNGLRSSIADVGIDFAKGENGDETWCTLTDYERNVRDMETFKGEYPDQVEEIVTWIEQAAIRNMVTVRFIWTDTTGVGDPVKSMLRRRMRQPVRGVVFTVQNKDVMAKKLTKAFNAKSERERISYPAHHKYTEKFEKQMKNLVKERRPSGQLNLTHGTGKNDHDDIPQSLMLSLWNMEKVRGKNPQADDEDEV